LRVWHDCGASVTCTRFGSGEGAVVASTWDSSINLWDVRSHALRQHYGKAHGGSPITEVAFHPSKDLLLSSSNDRLLRIWDLRAGRLCSSLEGHERPVLSCCWDERGEHFVSCDSEVVHFWSFPANSFGQGPRTTEVQKPEFQEAMGGVKGEVKAPMRCPEQTASEAAKAAPRQPAQDSVPPLCPQWIPAEDPLDASSGLGRLLQAAWAGESAVAPVPTPQAPCLTTETGQEVLPEAAAKVLEQLVTQMDVLTRTLENLEARLERTEAATQEVTGLIGKQSQTRSRGLPQQ